MSAIVLLMVLFGFYVFGLTGSWVDDYGKMRGGK